MLWRRKKEEEVISEDQLEYDECPNCRRRVKEFVKVNERSNFFNKIIFLFAPFYIRYSCLNRIKYLIDKINTKFNLQNQQPFKTLRESTESLIVFFKDFLKKDEHYRDLLKYSNLSIR